MKNIKKLPLIAIILIVIFSFSGLFKINLGGQEANFVSVTLLIGIVTFFITQKSEAESGNGDGLNIKAFPKDLKTKGILLWLMMPTVMNVICFAGAKLFLPEFLQHLNARTDYLAIDKLPLLVIELIIAALGEEIAWRAFFQKQLSKAIPFAAAVVISAALFAICHFTQGEPIVVLYDIVFIFINAVFYGIIFRKTGNAFVSTASHFLANLLGIVLAALL